VYMDSTFDHTERSSRARLQSEIVQTVLMAYNQHVNAFYNTSFQRRSESIDNVGPAVGPT
jgi:hypothetical protein